MIQGAHGRLHGQAVSLLWLLQVCPDSPSLNEGANLKSSPYAIFGRNSEGMDLNMPLKVIDVDGGQDEQMENAEKTVEITTRYHLFIVTVNMHSVAKLPKCQLQCTKMGVTVTPCCMVLFWE